MSHDDSYKETYNQGGINTLSFTIVSFTRCYGSTEDEVITYVLGIKSPQPLSTQEEEKAAFLIKVNFMSRLNDERE